VRDRGSHASGADDEQLPPVEVYAFAEPRDRALGEVSACVRAPRARATADGDRYLEQALKAPVEGASFHRKGQCLPDLVEHLVLADDGALEAGGHAHDMQDGLAAADRLEPRIDDREGPESVQLDAVTGLEEDEVGPLLDSRPHTLRQLSANAGA
jgi:hypothetical protein